MKSLKCPVCMNQFDLNKRLPRIIDTCGHTVCDMCMVNISTKFNPKCPRDNRKLKKLSSFPINFAIKEIIEQIHEPEAPKCSEHDEKIKWACMDHRKAMCSACAFRAHKDDVLKPFLELVTERDTKKVQIQSDLDFINEFYDDSLKQLENQHLQFTKAVDSKFKEILEVIHLKKTQMKTLLTSFFESQNKRLNSLVSDWSKVEREACKSIKNYETNVFGFLEDNISEKLSYTKEDLFNKEEYFKLIELSMIEQLKVLEEALAVQTKSFLKLGNSFNQDLNALCAAIFVKKPKPLIQKPEVQHSKKEVKKQLIQEKPVSKKKNGSLDKPQGNLIPDQSGLIEIKIGEKGRLPHPERFKVRFPEEDKKGFKILGIDYLFYYDSLGGWFDEFGNYYNSQGENRVHPPKIKRRSADPSRFEDFQASWDATYFQVPGYQRKFYFNEEGGWFDEFGNYYDCDGVPCNPPSPIIEANDEDIEDF